MPLGDAAQASKRLMREYKAFLKEKPPHISVKPDMDNLLIWHFVLYDLPQDTPYSKGIYHGRIDFPKEYPFGPPRIQMLTPNGRFKCNFPLCFSMSNYHPESWNPSWRVETILNAFLSFMLDAADPATTGGIITSDSIKNKLAIQSFDFNRKNIIFQRLFPEFCDESKYVKGIGFTFDLFSSSSSTPSMFSKAVLSTSSNSTAIENNSNTDTLQLQRHTEEKGVHRKASRPQPQLKTNGSSNTLTACNVSNTYSIFIPNWSHSHTRSFIPILIMFSVAVVLSMFFWR